MKKPVKVLLVGLGLLLVLLIGLAVALPLLFDPNDYRNLIAAKVKERTGRDLVLGQIELKVFPWLRARVDGVQLSNAPGFGDQPLAEIGQAEVGVKLMPLLLDRRAEVSTVRLKDVNLRLAVNAEGRNNWADLVQEKPEEREAAKDEDKGFSPRELDISGIELENTAASYQDARSGKQYSLRGLRLKTGAIRPGNPFDVDFATQLESAQPQLLADVSLKGQVKHVPEQQQLGIEDLVLDVKAAGPQLVGGKEARVDANLVGQLFFDQGKQQLNINGLQLKLKGAAAGLDADLQVHTRLFADLGNAVFQAPGLTLEGTVAGAAVPAGKQPIRLTTDAQLDRKNGALLLDKLQLNTAGLQLSSRIEGRGMNGDQPQLSGPVRIAAFNPRPLLQQLGVNLQTADPKALSQLSLEAQYEGSFQSLRLKNLAAQLDQSRVRGSFALPDFKTKALEFGLTIDQLDADRYLPPKQAVNTQGVDGKAPPPEKKTADDGKLPFEALQKLNANGTIDIGQLKLKGLTMSNVRLQLSGSPGGTQTQALSAQLYGGRVATTTRISPGAQPGLALQAQLNGLQAAPFLRDLTGKDRVSGIGNMTLDLTGRGETVDALKRTLNGTVSFRVEDGAVKGFNLAQVVRRAQAALDGNLNYQEAAARETDFAVFAASARVVNGVLHSDQLNGASPLFRVDGEGQIDLVNNTINYLAKPTVVKTSKGQGGKGLEDLAGITIPVKLTGNLFEPKVSLDLRAALQQQATAKLRERFSEKEDELRSKLQNKLGEKLGLDPAAGEKPLSEDQLKQQLNQRLGDFLSGRKRKAEPEAAPTPAPEPAAPAAAESGGTEPAPAP